MEKDPIQTRRFLCIYKINKVLEFSSLIVFEDTIRMSRSLCKTSSIFVFMTVNQLSYHANFS